MVKRRRNFRQKNLAKRKRGRTSRNTRKKTLKERFLTVALWTLSLVNFVLIASLLSDFFASPNEKPVSMNLPGNSTEEPQGEIITVEVLNACGVQGLAHDFTEYLRQNNFDVVNVGNYPGGFDLPRTTVLDRVSIQNVNATKIAKALGVDERQVQPQLEESQQLMVTVLIGKDYKTLKAYKQMRQDGM
ncbi:LytR C-terminal domain-containing protein [candidate division KSB1 bacterium]|nr:LytR C-terminal domain-containing protein [candidate division KSB1 bacterium]NIR70067.1 LytR C-terminal domain-containing protein [candidate division KSB1 bacterium]NIS27505.1 LytR C-terminal domain-containing protein [candidate division KSB1 bacterium]NIT74354.1 LytR C-terminal domain-containing protein [candidate division KSB1 bacterium]NIU28223.1 LytR C-terminal domain-containing protein [candidate division KSB1 bacterium]